MERTKMIKIQTYCLRICLAMILLKLFTNYYVIIPHCFSHYGHIYVYPVANIMPLYLGWLYISLLDQLLWFDL